MATAFQPLHFDPLRIMDEVVLGLMFATSLMAGPLLAADVSSGTATLTPASAEPEPTTAPEGVLLRYHFKSGEFTHFEMTSESLMTVRAKNVKQTIRNRRDEKKHFRVISVDKDGSALLEPVIDQLNLEIQADDNPPVVFDSREPQDAPRILKEAVNSIGKPILRIRYSKTGQVKQILPVSEEKVINDEDLQTFSFLIPLPDHRIKTGDSWHEDFVVEVGADVGGRRRLTQDIPFRRRFRLKEIKDDIAVVEFRTYPMKTVRDPRILTQLLKRSLHGLIQFDTERGLIREWSSKGSDQVLGNVGTGATEVAASTNSVLRYVKEPRRTPRKRPVAGPLPGPPQR